MRTAWWLFIISIPCLGGCSVFSDPRSPVDTDGDGKTDREMTQSEVTQWAKGEQEKAKRELTQEQREKEAQIAKAKREAARRIEDLEEAARKDARRIEEDLEASVEGLSLDLEKRLGDKQAWLSQVEGTANRALEEIRTKQEQIEGLFGLLQSPGAQALAGVVPGGTLVTGLAGAVAGLFMGRKYGKRVGVAEGKDIGWQERSDFQKESDASWDQGQAELLKLAASLKGLGAGGQAP